MMVGVTAMLKHAMLDERFASRTTGLAK